MHFQGKDSENERNMYNHNFEGLYCFCRRPYPDPYESSDDMNEANEANEVDLRPDLFLLICFNIIVVFFFFDSRSR